MFHLFCVNGGKKFYRTRRKVEDEKMTVKIVGIETKMENVIAIVMTRNADVIVTKRKVMMTKDDGVTGTEIVTIQKRVPDAIEMIE